MKLYDVYSLYEVTPVRGFGSYVYDIKGNEYLDFYGGHAVISIGHAHPHYVDKISAQLKNIGFYSNSIINPLQQELANKLASIANIKGFELFLINSGAEANENALKLASFYNGRSKMLSLENSFHGRTSAAINVTHSGIKHQSPVNKGIDTTYCKINDLSRIISELASKKYAGIIIEKIQGIGGLDIIGTEELQSISKACAESDTILIMDEVQCGYGRSGDFFAFQNSNIVPDIITTAKGMGNGFPIGGVLINAIKMPAVKSRLGTTYGGNHLACAAGIAVLDVIKEESLIKNAKIMGAIIQEELKRINKVKEVRGKGLMLGIEMDFPISTLRKNLIFNHQLFTGSAINPNLLRILPPLNVSNQEVEKFITKLSHALKSI